MNFPQLISALETGNRRGIQSRSRIKFPVMIVLYLKEEGGGYHIIATIQFHQELNKTTVSELQITGRCRSSEDTFLTFITPTNTRG